MSSFHCPFNRSLASSCLAAFATVMSFGTDRTADFLQVLQQSGRASHNLPNGHVNAAYVPDSPPPPNGLQKPSSDDRPSNGLLTANGRTLRARQDTSAFKSRSQFAGVAAQISKDLAVTCSRLESLSTLARQRTLFNDNSSEVQRLTLIIKDDINNLNHRIADLQKISKVQPGQSHQSAKHSSSVLMNLQTRLASMSDKFKTVLEQRSAVLQSQAARRNEYSARLPLASSAASVDDVPQHLLLSATQQQVGDASTRSAVIVPSILLQDEQRARRAAEGLSAEDGGMEGDDLGVRDFAGEQLNQRLLYRDQTDAYLQSRHETVRTIEHTIVELGQIFQQLATMVHEQEESVQRIDANVEDAVASVEAGHNELLRYFRSVSSNRWLMFKVFGVLFAFLLFFLIFVV
nr:unnamed protein product [Spirometra erinaceieuropaei]